MPLLRTITRWDMLAIMINATIGGGIYALPAEVYAKSGVWSIAAMMVCAVVISLIVGCFAEVGSRFSRTGGSLVYAYEAFGAFAGFITGWLSLVLRLVSMAAIGNIAVSYAGFLGFGIQPQSLAAGIVISVLITGLGLLNYFGIRPSLWLNNTFTIAKVITLLLFVMVGLYFIKPAQFEMRALPARHDFTASILLMVFAFSGFDSAVTTTGEMKNPQRDIPYTLFRVLLFKTVLYLLVQIVCIGTLVTLAGSKKPLSEAAETMLPGFGGWFITIGALISFIATLNGGMLVTSRICYGLVEQKQLPAWFGATHRRYKSPHISIMLTTVAILFFALTNSLLVLLTITAMGRLLIYIITCAALIRLRQKAAAPAAAFIQPYGKILAALGMVACILILTGSNLNEWVMMGGVLAVGAVVWGTLQIKQ
jgi:amino acid transporter